MILYSAPVWVRFWAPEACYAIAGTQTSYGSPPPTALEGMMRRIYWHPGVGYNIEELSIENDEGFNLDVVIEYKKRPTVTSGLNGLEPIRTPRMVMVNPAFTVKIIMTYNEQGWPSEKFSRDREQGFSEKDLLQKHFSILNRRLRTHKWGVWGPPCMGISEFYAEFELVDDPENIKPVKVTKHLGKMPKKMEYRHFTNLGVLEWTKDLWMIDGVVSFS